jgi:YVTN family beta-propeller protein
VLRTRTSLTIAAASLATLVLPACNGGGGHGSGSTAAPITSTTPGGVNSGTTGGTNSGSTGGTTSQTPTLLTNALVSSFSLKQLMDVDAATGQVSNTWSTGNGPTDVANWGFDAYVANTLSQDVTVIDRLANNVVTTVDVTSTPITGVSLLSFLDPVLKPLVRPTGIAVTPNGLKAYSANLLNVTVIDTTSNTPTKSILGIAPLNLSQLLTSPSTAISNFMASPVPGLGMGKVAATNDYAVATCMISGKLMRIDAHTDHVIDYVDVGRAPIGVTIAQNKAYVACALSQEIDIIDLATGTLRGTIQAGMIPVDCASSPSEDKVYVANAVSGDITVIDTAADVVVDTLPAGLSLANIIGQLGITLPNTSGGGLAGALNGFLQGFTGGMTNPNSFGALIAGAGSGSLLSPANLINGLLTGFLSYVGVTQQALQGLNLPAFGLFSVAVAHNPVYVCSANALMGDMAVTETTTRNVSSLMGLTGLGPADVSTVWRR